MRKSVSHLTIVLLAAHSVLGCCWHHKHAGQHESVQSVAPEVCDDCRHVALAESGPGTSAPSDRPHQEPAPCKTPRCVFVPSKPLRAPTSSIDRLPPPPFAQTFCRTWPAELQGLSVDDTPAQVRPSLRIHLMKQVLMRRVL